MWHKKKMIRSQKVCSQTCSGEIPPVKTDDDEKSNDSNPGDESEGESKVDGDEKVDVSSPWDEPECANK